MKVVESVLISCFFECFGFFGVIFLYFKDKMSVKWLKLLFVVVNMDWEVEVYN